VEGLVLRVDPARQTLVVSHRDIPGYMQAMVMPFRVKRAAELDGLTPGARVRFQLVAGKRASFARGIVRVRAAIDKEVTLPRPAETVSIGGVVPDFTLTDQLQRTVRLSDFRGKLVAVDFIYTRCPLPDVCPRLSATFATLQRRFQPRMGRNLVLLSVTIDPQYDTPAVLAEYGRIWRADPAGWHFLTGTTEDVLGVANRFGLVYWPEEGMISHTVATALVGRDGSLVAVVEGASFTAAQLGDLIEANL
jgi:protein SCO1